MLKVLHLVSSNHFAGSERLALTLGGALAATGKCQVAYAIRGGGILGGIYQRAGVELAPVRLNALFAGLRLASWVRQNGIGLLHCHMTSAARLGAKIARRCKIPCVTHLHFLKDSPIYRDPASGLLISISEHVTQFYRDTAGVPAERIRTIPNAIHAFDDEWADVPKHTAAAGLRAEFGLPASARILSFVGRVSPEKGHEFFLRALPAVLARHPATHAFIVGNLEQKAGYAAKLRGLCAGLSLERNVHFTGFRPDTLRFTRAADAQLVLSRDEPFGLVAPEAMALETPVIGSDSGNIPNILEHGRLGTLVPYGDSAALARAICELLEGREGLPAKTRAACESARALYHPAVMAGNILSAYAAAGCRGG